MTEELDDAPEELPERTLLDSLLYGLSVPERMTRSIAAAAGGVVSETSARLIPLAFRSSRSYAAFIQQSLDLLVHDVGGVDRPPPPPGQTAAGQTAAVEADIPLARKAVGGILDFAGGATMHLSPITILALINDIAYGSNTFLKQLAEELRREGIIDDESTIHHVSDLLDAVGRTSGNASAAVEAPPLDVAALRKTVEQLRSDLNSADPASIIPQTELVRMWDDMREIADASKLGFWQVGSAIGLHTIGRLDMVTRGTLSSVRVAGNLFDQHIIDHYADAITAIHRDGLYQTIATTSAPYLDAVWENFSPARKTWTDQLLTWKLFG